MIYCPNCGKRETSDAALACSICHMPFDDLAERVTEHRSTAPAADEKPGIPKERLIAAAAFVALAAIPVGLGVKNSLQTGTTEALAPRNDEKN